MGTQIEGRGGKEEEKGEVIMEEENKPAIPMLEGPSLVL